MRGHAPFVGAKRLELQSNLAAASPDAAPERGEPGSSPDRIAISVSRRSACALHDHRERKPHGFNARAIIPVIVLIAASLLSACSGVVDAERARLCRIAMAGLNPAQSRFDILRTRPIGPDWIAIDYRVEPPAVLDGGARRDLVCAFEPAGHGDSVRNSLVGITSDGEPLSPIRLHLLRQQWLALADDPHPLPPVAVAQLQVGDRTARVLQHILSALPQTAIYGLLAAAYALIYGLIGRINLAFGDLATLGSYAAFLGLMSGLGGGGIGPALALALVVAATVAALHGAVIGARVFAPLARSANQTALIASVGLALALQEYLRLAHGPGNRVVPPLLNAPILVAAGPSSTVTMTPIALIVSAAALTAALALVALITRAPFGRRWRAVADDPLAAAMLGVDTRRLLVVSFALSGALAGLAGFISAAYYGTITPTGGLVLGLKALIAAVAGGIGSVPGALLGGLLLGFAEALWSFAFSIESRDAAIFVLLVVMLVVRPGGLFGGPK